MKGLRVLTIAKQINGVNYPVFRKSKTFYNIKSLNGKTIITKNIRGF